MSKLYFNYWHLLDPMGHHRIGLPSVATKAKLSCYELHTELIILCKREAYIKIDEKTEIKIERIILYSINDFYFHPLLPGGYDSDLVHWQN